MSSPEHAITPGRGSALTAVKDVSVRLILVAGDKVNGHLHEVVEIGGALLPSDLFNVKLIESQQLLTSLPIQESYHLVKTPPLQAEVQVSKQNQYVVIEQPHQRETRALKRLRLKNLMQFFDSPVIVLDVRHQMTVGEADPQVSEGEPDAARPLVPHPPPEASLGGAGFHVSDVAEERPLHKHQRQDPQQAAEGEPGKAFPGEEVAEGLHERVLADHGHGRAEGVLHVLVCLLEPDHHQVGGVVEVLEQQAFLRQEEALDVRSRGNGRGDVPCHHVYVELTVVNLWL